MGIKPVTKEAYQLFHEATLVFADMEAAGIRIDVERLEKNIAEVDRRIKELDEKLRDNPIYAEWRNHFGSKTKLGSGEQLGKILYDVMKYPVTMWTGGGTKGKPRPSTADKALQQIDLSFVKDWLKRGDYLKLRNTTLKNIQQETVDGFIHPFFPSC